MQKDRRTLIVKPKPNPKTVPLPNKAGAVATGKGRLRIIGGQWRSRHLPIVDLPGLRPTPDRVRETLFNWLQFDIHSKRCLDLFAGSGALGFEALSRSASEVVLVEKQAKAIQQLQQNITTLAAKQAILYAGDAFDYLRSATGVFDIIFLDPPFQQQLLLPALDVIAERQLLQPMGWLYAEYERELVLDWFILGYQVQRSFQAGEVSCALLRPLRSDRE